MYQVCIRKICVVFLSLLSWGAVLQAKLPQDNHLEKFRTGKHYFEVSESIRANKDVKQLRHSDDGKPQVLMFFSYGCYWCGQLSKPFDQWAHRKSKENIAIHRYPVVFNRMWGELAKLYYTVEALEQSHRLDDKIFHAVHEEQLRIWEASTRKKFFAGLGFEPSVVEKTYASFSIAREVQRTVELMNAFDITATPNIIVNGSQRSYMTNLTMVENIPQLFEVIEYLVKECEKPFVSS